MKKILVFFLLLGCLANRANAALGIGVTALSTFSSASPLTATLSGSVSIGTVIEVSISMPNGGCGTPVVTDSVNTGTYATLTGFFDSGTNNQVYVYWIIANHTGTPVVSFSNPTSCFAQLSAMQIIGFAGTPTADTALANDALGTGTALSIAATNSFNNEIMFVSGAVLGGVTPTSGGSGWTANVGCTQVYACNVFNGTIFAYSIEASASTSNAYAATFSTAQSWTIVVGGIYDAPRASSAGPPVLSGADVVLSGATVLASFNGGGNRPLVKWHTGYYGLTNSQPFGPGTAFTNYQAELNVINGESATVKGYTVWGTWSGYESSTLGNWQFTGCTTLTTSSRSGCASTFVLDQILNQAWSQSQRVILVINPNIFNTGTLSAPAQSSNAYVPNYIINDGGTGLCPTYGVGLYGSSGVSNTSACGFWVQQSGGWGANIENANVQTRFKAMTAQLCAVYDQDPVLEGIIFVAMDNNYPYAGTGATGSPFYTAWQNVVAATKAACPHTNVGIQVAFDSGGGAMENFTTWLVQNKMVMSASDTPGSSMWSTIWNLPGCTSLGGYWSATPSGTGGTLAAGNTWEYQCSSSTVLQPYDLLLGSQHVSAVFTQGSASVTWTPAISDSPSSTQGQINWNPLNLPAGVAAWIGYSPVGSGYVPPTPSLFSLNSGFMLVEGGDFCTASGSQPLPGAVAFSDIINASNTYLQNSHLSVTIFQNSGQCSAPASALWGGAGGVYATMQANPLTYTAYPSIY